MTPDERPEGPDRPDEVVVGAGVPDAGVPDADVPDADTGDEGPVEVDMRFTVIDRADGRVHLLSEGGGVLFAHPAVCDEVWDAALDEVPEAWEIVDLPEPIADVVARSWHPSQGYQEPCVDGFDPDELAERQFELLTSFVRAGFDRHEAMALVLEMLRAEGPEA